MPDRASNRPSVPQARPRPVPGKDASTTEPARPAFGDITNCRQSHVVKRMAPNQAGAMKLAERFGDRLVCVRYRHDTTGHHRYTTVELLVDSGPIRHRDPNSVKNRKTQIVAIQLLRQEHHLRALLSENGAVCAPDTGLWYVLRSTAKALDLLHRVV